MEDIIKNEITLEITERDIKIILLALINLKKKKVIVETHLSNFIKLYDREKSKEQLEEVKKEIAEINDLINKVEVLK